MSVKQMTLNSIRIAVRLRNFMDFEDAWGVDEGRKVHSKLLEFVENYNGPNPASSRIFAISLEGVRRTDASFPRESVMQLAHRFRKEHGFCLCDFTDPDLLENWEAAAIRRQQPMLLWREGQTGMDAHLLGPTPSEGLRSVFEILVANAQRSEGEIVEFTASDITPLLGISIPNASNKLKTLWEEGYVLRREQTAPSGGIEFRYFVAR